MEVKHTQGRWDFIDKRPDYNGLSIFAGDQYIAFVGDSDSITNAEANARLISAAPDLLEALTNLLLWAQEVHRAGPHAKLNYAGMDDARVAIKKATGVWHGPV